MRQRQVAMARRRRPAVRSSVRVNGATVKESPNEARLLIAVWQARHDRYCCDGAQYSIRAGLTACCSKRQIRSADVDRGLVINAAVTFLTRFDTQRHNRHDINYCPASQMDWLQPMALFVLFRTVRIMPHYAFQCIHIAYLYYCILHIC